MTAARTIAAWALGLTIDDIPAEVARAASRHLLDGVGVAVAAVRLGAVPWAVDVAASVTAPAEATIIGSGARVPSPMAALANGALVHGLDFDDTHAEALVHMTAAVLPASFAVGEETGATGAQVLSACVAGYEVVARLGAAVPHGFHRRGFHPTSVCGVFASALTASKLLGLTAAEAASALGIAGSLASGSLEFLTTGSATKPLHPGFAGMNGILAARLAAAGAEGPETIFEGEYGLFRSFLGETIVPGELSDGLGSRWETTRIAVKPYPVCQLSQASLDALATCEAVAGEISEIVFDVPPANIPIVCEPIEAKRHPRTPYEGKFSLPYCAATLVIDGEVTVASFDADRLERKDVLDLASRVSYRSREFDGPPADAPGIVEMLLVDGRVLHGRVERGRGDPAAPLSDEELLRKFKANCGAGAEPLSRALLDLASLPSMAAVMSGATR